MESEFDTVKLSKVKTALRYAAKADPLNGDPDISFEYLVGSFFPNVLNNIKDTMTKNYMEGYNKGYEEAKKEIENGKND